MTSATKASTAHFPTPGRVPAHLQVTQTASTLRKAWLGIAVAALMFLQGCACISAGEYGNQCCSACGILCTQTCIPVCIDTALGKGPFNSAVHGVKPVAESDPAPAGPQAQAAVAY